MAPQRDWLDKDFYAVLGVPQNATQAEIKKAYRKLAQTLHPDANHDDASAAERFKAVSEAYSVVGNEEKRKEYDDLRQLAASGGFNGGGGGFPGGFTFGAGDVGDFDDIIRQVFGGARGGGGRARAARKGADLEAEVHLSFEDALAGVTTTLRVTGDGPCDTCGGSGARPGTAPQRCPQCEGAGAVAVDQGMFSMSQPCPTCSGRGAVVDDPCATCHGSGRQVKPREIRARIPAGVRDGAVIRLAGRGGPGVNGGKPGDLFVRVVVAPHPVFGRKGDDVTLDVPITYAEAALGMRLRVPTPDGGATTIKIPTGTASGRTFRVRGKGAPNRSSVTGDLLVTVTVVVPTAPSARERELLEELKQHDDDDIRGHLFGQPAAANRG